MEIFGALYMTWLCVSVTMKSFAAWGSVATGSESFQDILEIVFVMCNLFKKALFSLKPHSQQKAQNTSGQCST